MVIFIPRHTTVAGYYGLTLDIRVFVRLSVHQSFVHPSVSPSIFRFWMITWENTKLGMCIDILDIWFGIANGQISSNFFGVICPRHAHIFVSGW